MSRSYNVQKVKKNRVYSVDDLISLYGVSANTVSNWVRAGLRRSDDQRPYLFRGGAVAEFLKARRDRSMSQLNPGEFKCFGCKAAVFPRPYSVSIWEQGNKTTRAMAYCSECSRVVSKFVSAQDLEVIDQLRNQNTTESYLHEENCRPLSRVGSSGDIAAEEWWGTNDRLLFAWQCRAGRYAEATIDQHLASIRYMEDVLGGLSFQKLTVRDVDQVRTALKTALRRTDDGRLSRSMVSHRVSHLKDFLEWLPTQDRYRRLSGDLADYIQMPKAVYAEAMPRLDKSYPTIEEAEQLLRDMPRRNMADRRACAMFAIAFLGALRADTITSLLCKHVDVDNLLILQDGSQSRTKNGKSLRISMFPIAPIFLEVIRDWKCRLEDMGVREDDALFPKLDAIRSSAALRKPFRPPIVPMTTKDVVAKAFLLACRNSETKYNPHSVKDTLAAERDRRELTQLQRKAWSENMGHENEKITETHYGKLSEADRFRLLGEITERREAGLLLVELSDQQKAALFDKIYGTIWPNMEVVETP